MPRPLVQFRIPEEELEAARQLARAEKRTLTSLIRVSLARYIEHHGEGNRALDKPENPNGGK